MKIELGFLRTKVARSLFLRFVICALLPLGVLAAISARSVGRYLDERNDERLGDAAIATERAVSDRLASASRDTELLAELLSRSDLLSPADLLSTVDVRSAGERVSGGSEIGLAEAQDGQSNPGAAFHSHFRALAAASIVSPAGTESALFGAPVVPPVLDQAQVQHLREGRTLLVVRDVGAVPGLFMGRALGGEPDQVGVLWTRLDRAYFWKATAHLAALPPLGALNVLSADLGTLHGPPTDDAFSAAIQSSVEDGSGRGLPWQDARSRHRFVTRPIALGAAYQSPDWQVVVSMPEEMVTAPLRDFTLAFLPLMLTAFLVVLLLSDAQIRKTIRPLELIHDATKRIASDDFSGRLDIQSKDEFRDLAHSFNHMSDRLGKQIQTLTAIGDVDRAGLSARDSRQIVDALLQTLLNVVDCETVSVCTFDQDGPGAGKSYAVSRDSREVTIVKSLAVDSDDWCGAEDYILLGPEARAERACLNVPPFGDHAHQRFLVLPLELRDRRAGLISFASTNSAAFPPDEISRLRQIADQATLALSNVDRLDELGRMSMGALTALARTIDANSTWTAGHSERVTRVATLIGQKIGLDPEQLDSLRRGGLLHDIGKIGVPVEVLNKPGALSKEEFEAVKAHVTVGQRILEPIEAYSDLIPIVRHHHERIDGKGYPDGLSGDEIHLFARIVGVADTFDALTSDRPYRKGLPVKTAIEVIRNAAGTQLDPQLVRAFLELIEEGELDFRPGRLEADDEFEEEKERDQHRPVTARVVSRV